MFAGGSGASWGWCVCFVGTGVGFAVLFLFPFLFFCLFPCAWVGPIHLLLCDLIVHRCRPIGGALPYLDVNAGRFDEKKKKKKPVEV